MAAQELRPMGIGDILDTAFRLYRQRFLTFLLIAMIVYVPYALLLASFKPFQVAAQPVLPEEAQMQMMFAAAQPNLTATVLTFIGIALFGIVLMPLCTAALVQNISASYLGEDLTAGQSYGRAAPRLLGLIGTYLLVGLIFFLGVFLISIITFMSPWLLLLAVPVAVIVGVMLSLWFLLITPVVVLERRAGASAMGRSRELMQGNYNKGIGLGFLVLILTWVIVFVVNTLTEFVPWPHAAVQVFVANLVQAFILPIQTTPLILLYYDLRIRKEAFDLEKLAEALGQPAPPAGQHVT